jgi:hypothetical protein
LLHGAQTKLYLAGVLSFVVSLPSRQMPTMKRRFRRPRQAGHRKHPWPMPWVVNQTRLRV